MVVAALDHLTLSDLALEAYQQAREPKRLVLLPDAHFDAYVKASTPPAARPATGSWNTWAGRGRALCRRCLARDGAFGGG